MANAKVTTRNAEAARIAARKQAAFLKEQLTKRRQLRVSGVLVSLTLVALVIIFGGQPLAPVREALGIAWITNDTEGVYADCSKRENRNNRFCSPTYSNVSHPPAPERDRSSSSPFVRPSDSLPFSLH